MRKNNAKQMNENILDTSYVLEHNFPIGIFKIGISDQVSLLSANDFFYEFLGTKFEDYKDGFFSDFGNSDRLMYENYIKDCALEKNSFSIEFKINQKLNDEIVWVHMEARFVEEKDGTLIFVCVLWDVSKKKHAELELNELKNLYLKAISSGDEMIFDYNVSSDVFVYYKLVEEDGVIINKPNVRSKFLENLSVNRDVYPDDLVYFYDLCRDNILHPFDVRFRRSHQKQGEYTKLRVHATVEKDSLGRPCRIIGTTRPIEDVKYNDDSRKIASEKDELTGIFSRSAARKRIEEYLLSSTVESPYALLILDIKGFKSVNDSYGHIFGDNVLIQVADTIIENIGHNDIVGRLGGDEFLIFMKNVSETAVYGICDKIRREICNIYVGEDSKIDVCIGAIVEVNHSITVDELVQTADASLFDIIISGEAGVSIAKELIKTKEKLKISYVADRNIRSTPRNTEKRLSELIFELLEQAKDLNKAIDTVLALVGEKKGLSRITMLRREGSKLYVTREWVSRGFKAKNRNKTSSLLAYQNKMKSNFEEDGMGVIDKESVLRFDPDTVKEMLSEGAKSIMYCNMMEFGDVVGVIAFVDCVNEREWTQMDYKAFRTVTRMISAYTYKAEVVKMEMQKTK